MDNILAIDSSNTYVEILKNISKNNLYHIETYDPAIGLPKMSQDWHKYSMILLSYNLSLDNETGLDWLKIIIQYPEIPPIALIIDILDKDISIQAIKNGAVSCISSTTLNADNMLQRIKQSIALAAPSRDNSKGYVTGIFDVSASIQIDHEIEKTSADLKHEALQEKYTKLNIPGYQLISEMVEGGMSKVFKSKRLEDGLTVVLKVLFTTDYQEPNALKRFMQEYSIIGKINNEHIVHIYERGFAADFSYIAFEYLSHGSLTRRIRRGLSDTDSIEYLKQMAQGLSAIHENNIVHRDLKPGNILFSSKKILKIIDFGVAENIETEAQDLTVTGCIMGTPQYMSPEQCLGFPVDPRSDIYSLGIIFYAMLTGKTPFKAKEFEEFLLIHKKNIMPKLPPQYEKYQPLLDGMVAKAPEERFQTIDDLLMGIKWIEDNKK